MKVATCKNGHELYAAGFFNTESFSCEHCGEEMVVTEAAPLLVKP